MSGVRPPERLAATVTGAGRGPRVVLLHGFTQTGASWSPIAEPLGADHEVLAVDAPGHGGSASVRADLWRSAALLATSVGPAAYVGYSMGGRMALHVAIAHPEVVESLVLVSTTAGIDDPAERTARRDADAACAVGAVGAVEVPPAGMGWREGTGGDIGRAA